MSDVIIELQEWYVSQCDGDWEHTYGIVIETLDNPGWAVEIDLSRTELEAKSYEEWKEQEENSAKWIHCRVERKQDGRLIFSGTGDSTKLSEIIRAFLSWARTPTLEQ